MLNILVQLGQERGARAAVQRFCHSKMVRMKEAPDTPISIKALISMILEELVNDPIPKSAQKLLCKNMLLYSSLRSLIPAAMVLPSTQNFDADKLARIITDLLPAPKSKLENHVYRQAFHTLKLQANADEFSEVVTSFFKKVSQNDMP